MKTPNDQEVTRCLMRHNISRGDFTNDAAYSRVHGMAYIVLEYERMRHQTLVNRLAVLLPNLGGELIYDAAGGEWYYNFRNSSTSPPKISFEDAQRLACMLIVERFETEGISVGLFQEGDEFNYQLYKKGEPDATFTNRFEAWLTGAEWVVAEWPNNLEFQST